MSRVLAPSKSPSLFGFPRSLTGRASVWLVAVFFATFGFYLVWSLVPRDRSTFFSDPVHAALLLAASLAGSAGGVAGIVSLLVKRERALLLAVTSIVGLVVLFTTLGQLAR